MKLKLGDQIVYVPGHLWDQPLKFGYPNGAQPGFVTGLNSESDYFCRYWIIKNGKPINELRTKANSKLTPSFFVKRMDTVPQEWVDDAIRILMDGTGELG